MRAKKKGELAAEPSPLASEVEAWAIMGMNVFLGLRFAVWGKEDPAEVARLANRLIRRGLAALAGQLGRERGEAVDVGFVVIQTRGRCG